MKYLIKQLVAIALVWGILHYLLSDSLVWQSWQDWGRTVGWTFLALLLARPIYQIVTLPINLITFGLFRGLFYIVMMAAIDWLVPGLTIGSINLAQFNPYLSGIGLVLPETVFSGWWAYLLLAILFNFFYQIISWVIN